MTEDTVKRLMGLAADYAVCAGDYERQPSAHAKPFRLRMEAARSALESAIREALLDTARLDYIEQHARRDPKMDGNHVWWPTTFNDRLTGPTLRAAIDAMKDRP